MSRQRRRKKSRLRRGGTNRKANEKKDETETGEEKEGRRFFSKNYEVWFCLTCGYPCIDKEKINMFSGTVLWYLYFSGGSHFNFLKWGWFIYFFMSYQPIAGYQRQKTFFVDSMTLGGR